MASEGDVRDLKRVIDDVFLPPKLPGQDCGSSHDNKLLALVHSALEAFTPLARQKDRATILATAEAVRRLKQARNRFGVLDEAAVACLLEKLSTRREYSSADSWYCSCLLTGSDFLLPLHIKAQNAGLLIWKKDDDFVFETFELTPPSATVIKAEGRLKRTFPSEGVVVNLEVFTSPQFRSAVASTIAKMSFETAPGMCGEISTPNGKVDDTAAPNLVTELLISFLLANGKPATEPTVRKHTREEIILNEGNEVPWRRSAFWLFLRVTLHLQMSRFDGGQDSGLYKRFMVFFMAQFLRSAVDLDMNSDLLFAMSAKVARRLVKLNIRRQESWMPTVHKHMSAVTRVLDARMKHILADDKQTLGFTKLSGQAAEADTTLHLPDLDAFLDHMSLKQCNYQSGEFSPTSAVLQVSSDQIPDVAFIEDHPTHEFQNLYAFETWVAVYLDAWTRDHLHDDETCAKLKRTIEVYHKISHICYDGSPEGNSMMILTILELWIACDKSAVAQHPLLANYSHDVPLRPFELLHLRFKGDMERLCRAERYLIDRSSAAYRSTKAVSAIFTYDQETSFSTSFVASSVDHGEVLAAIKSRTDEQRTRHQEEFNRLMTRFNELMDLRAVVSCEQEDIVDHRGRSRKRHASRCQRCQTEDELAVMDIEVFEEPLPSKASEAASVVFELLSPPAFAAWRDSTIILLEDVLGLRPRQKEKIKLKQRLQCWPGLDVHFREASPEQRVVLATASSPTSRRKRIALSSTLTFGDTFVPSTIRWQLFDNALSSAIGKPIMTEAVSQMCSLPFEEELRFLQPFLTQQRAPNDIITQQAERPGNLSPAEFRALCSMSFGRHIQWMNVLVQLALPSVD